MRAHWILGALYFSAFFAACLESVSLLAGLGASRAEGGLAFSATWLAALGWSLALGALAAPRVCAWAFHLRRPLIALGSGKVALLGGFALFWHYAARDLRDPSSDGLSLLPWICGLFVGVNSAATQAALGLVNATGLSLLGSDRGRVIVRVCGTIGYGAGLIALVIPFSRKYHPTMFACAVCVIIAVLAAALPAISAGDASREEHDRRGRGFFGIGRQVGFVPLIVAFLVAATSGLYESYINLYITNNFRFLAPSAVQGLKLLPEVPFLFILPRLRRLWPGSLLLTGPAAWLLATGLLSMSLVSGSPSLLFAAILLAGVNASFETAVAWRVHAAATEANRFQGQAVLVAILGAGRCAGTLGAWLVTIASARSRAIPWPALWTLALCLAGCALILIAVSTARTRSTAEASQ